MDLPIFNFIVNEDIDDMSGVFTVSIVKQPAIELPAQFFNEHKILQKFQVVNEDERIISGPVLVADKPIFRRDEDLGDYFIKFDTENIKKIMQKFFRLGLQSSTNLEHNELLRMEGITMFESFQIDRDKGKNPPKGYEELTDGSWFGSFKVFDNDVWELIKSGNFTGFSIEGIPANYIKEDIKEDTTEDNKEKELYSEINSLLDSIL